MPRPRALPMLRGLLRQQGTLARGGGRPPSLGDAPLWCLGTGSLGRPWDGVPVVRHMSAVQGPAKIVPPFTAESARAKVQFAEDAWNSRDPERVSLGYTVGSDWRNRTEFFVGREAIKDFLRRKWAKELGYRLMKELWCYTDNKIAVRFEYEWHDEGGQWWRTHGNELWEFDPDGLMRRRDMSANDYKIAEHERRIKVARP